jgi:gas vesicle protein
MSEKQSSHAFFWGFVAGAVATAAYTLLKTPRSGRETIDQIKGHANQLLGRTQNAASDWQEPARTAARSWQTQTEDAAKQTQATVQEAAEQTQDKVQEAAQQVQDQASEVVAAGQEAVGDLAESAKQSLES